MTRCPLALTTSLSQYIPQLVPQEHFVWDNTGSHHDGLLRGLRVARIALDCRPMEQSVWKRKQTSDNIAGFRHPSDAPLRGSVRVDRLSSSPCEHVHRRQAR